MKKIATLYEKDLYPDIQSANDVVYAHRLAVRSLVFDNEKKIALVGNIKHRFLLLPGGGIEPGETMHKAIVRECLEEIGCNVSIQNEIGYIDDYRSRDKKHTTNYCYICRVVGQKGKPKHTAYETEIGMFTKWTPFDEAITILKKQRDDLKKEGSTYYNTGFNIVRDYLFLKEAKKILNNLNLSLGSPLFSNPIAKT